MVSRGLVLVILFLGVVASKGQVSTGHDSRLVAIGVELFPRVIALDLDIAEKLGEDRTVFLAVVYKWDHGNAIRLSLKLGKTIDSIAGYAVRVTPVHESEFPHLDLQPHAVFLCERVEDSTIDSLHDHASRDTLFFSPFKEHLTYGVHVSIFITATVKPYLNQSALRRSRIRFHKSLMSVSKKYE